MTTLTGTVLLNGQEQTRLDVSILAQEPGSLRRQRILIAQARTTPQNHPCQGLNPCQG